MGVMPTGMHDAITGRAVGCGFGILDVKGVDVGAEGDTGAVLLAFGLGNQAAAWGSDLDVQTLFDQLPREELSGLVFLATRFGMSMEMPAQCNPPLALRVDGRIDRLSPVPHERSCTSSRPGSVSSPSQFYNETGMVLHHRTRA